MIGLAIAAALSLAPPAWAQDDPFATCPVDEDVLTGSAWLRAVSLDLRGVVPTPEEYADVEAGTPVEDLVDAWLQTDAFAWQVVRHHRSLLRTNVADIRLLSNRQRLIAEGDVWWRYLVAPHYRGGPEFCGDFEATYDDDGDLLVTVGEDGVAREGWVWVNPYWDMDNPIKVCAFEAQEARVSPWGTECDTYDSRYDPYCGCGPNLAWCDTAELGHNGGNPRPPVAVGIVGDVEQRVFHMIADDQSYLELLTGRTAYVNGPLAHFYRYQTRVPAHIRFNEVPIDPDLMPDLAFEDDETWVPVELGPEQSGILTSTFYLMKYQTRRARANRFYDGFLCQPFQPPDGGLDDLDDPNATLDLSAREGCNYCHAILEPAGAHWGRWGEYGAGYLDPADYPAYDDECAWCANSGASCSAACSNYYIIDPLSSEEDPGVGYLDAYEFTEDRHLANIEEGPTLAVNSAVVDGRLPQCVARRTAEWLLGRELRTEEDPWLDDLTVGFTTSEFRYSELVREIVTSERYRRVQ
jgi:hypothetical protein